MSLHSFLQIFGFTVLVDFSVPVHALYIHPTIVDKSIEILLYLIAPITLYSISLLLAEKESKKMKIFLFFLHSFVILID